MLDPRTLLGCGRDGHAMVLYDHGNTPVTLEWERVSEWKEHLLADLPTFELHHGFDILKSECAQMPIELSELMEPF